MLESARDSACFTQLSADVDASEKHTEQPDGDGVLEGSRAGASLLAARPRRGFFSSNSSCGSLVCVDSGPLVTLARTTLAKKTGTHATIGEAGEPLCVALSIVGMNGFEFLESGVLAGMMTRVQEI
jgi:hypothetical protein